MGEGVGQAAGEFLFGAYLRVEGIRSKDFPSSLWALGDLNSWKVFLKRSRSKFPFLCYCWAHRPTGPW